MFITPAYAQAAGGGAGGGFGFGSLWVFVVIFLIMYLLIIRPQRKQLKKREELLNSVRRGDSIVTGGGIIGKVTKVFDDSGEVEVEISDGVRIRVLRSTISDIRTKGEPVADKKESSPMKLKANKIQAAEKVKAKNFAKNKDAKPAAQTANSGGFESKPSPTETKKKDDTSKS